jgi:hypothetical protein
MKIYTEVIYHWDDDKGELVQESEKSYDYYGPLTLAHVKRTTTTFLEYPPSIGQSLKHWVTFEAFDFRSGGQTLGIDLYIPPDALATSYKSDYDSALHP